MLKQRHNSQQSKPAFKKLQIIPIPCCDQGVKFCCDAKTVQKCKYQVIAVFLQMRNIYSNARFQYYVITMVGHNGRSSDNGRSPTHTKRLIIAGNVVGVRHSLARINLRITRNIPCIRMPKTSRLLGITFIASTYKLSNRKQCKQ